MDAYEAQRGRVLGWRRGTGFALWTGVARTVRSPAGALAAHVTCAVTPDPTRLLLAHVTPLIARSKPLSRSWQQSPRLVTLMLVICSGCAIGTVTSHHGDASFVVCVQLPELQLTFLLPSMARPALPP